MVTLIIFIIFILSLGGVIFILVRKLPELNMLPQHGTAGIREHHIVQNIEGRIKTVFVFFEKQIFLHKLLSWVKVMTLKIETKIDKVLHKIRKKAQQIDKDNKAK